jgi:hypothetical protein
MWLWGHSLFKIIQLGQFFMELSDYYDAPPHKQSPTLRSCRINERLIKLGKHNRSLKVAMQGPELLAHPSYIHTLLFFSYKRRTHFLKENI